MSGGGFWRGRSRRQLKASLTSSLGISVPSWELVSKVIHPPPSQTRFGFRLAFFPTVEFRHLVSPSYLSNLLSLPASHPSLTIFACALRSSPSPLNSEVVRTSQQCYNVSKDPPTSKHSISTLSLQCFGVSIPHLYPSVCLSFPLEWGLCLDHWRLGVGLCIHRRLSSLISFLLFNRYLLPSFVYGALLCYFVRATYFLLLLLLPLSSTSQTLLSSRSLGK